jgi:hypothetical protein
MVDDLALYEAILERSAPWQFEDVALRMELGQLVI